MKISSLTACAALSLALAGSATAGPVAVRFAEPAGDRALVLRTLDGRNLARGSVKVTVLDGQATSQVVFHFADGSLHDETTVFSQDGVLRLLNYRLVQKGPAFPRTLEMTLDSQTGRAIVRHRAGNATEAVEETLGLPSDIANGMMVPVLKNFSGTAPVVASWVAPTPKPRSVKLVISIAADPARVAGRGSRTTHYVVKAEIGGLSGVLAPLVGKQPPDTHVWISGSDLPVFIKSEGPLYVGGPVWRIEVP